MFLIGDKVTIKDDMNTSKYLVVNGSMAKLAGREAIITSANIINDGYRIDLDNGQYIWKGYMFEGGHMKAYLNTNEGQEAKADAGKLQMMLMLPEINKAVVRVREYGIIEPAKVIRNAVENAGSAAVMFCNIGGMIAEVVGNGIE